MRFPATTSLADLPWFDLADGRLVLADPDVPPIVDVHCHLALSFLRRPTVDLRRETLLTETYLPAGSAFDLDLYANRSLTPDDLDRLTRDLTLHSLGPTGMRATHTIANLARDMADTGIAHSVLLAIDLPWRLSRNALTWLALVRGDARFTVFGSVHPFDSRVAWRLDRQVAMGARGVKVHPAVQLVAPSAQRCLSAYRMCGERGLPVFFHCGPVDIETRLGRRLSQVAGYERAVAECPETAFVLGHSGALQFDDALRLAATYPNVWLDLACQSLPAIRAAMARAPHDRLLTGSDWPFYPQSHMLAKVLVASEGDPGTRSAVLQLNAARLLGRAA